MITRPQLIAFAELDDELANQVSIGVLSDALTPSDRGRFTTRTFTVEEALQLSVEVFEAAAQAATDRVQIDDVIVAADAVLAIAKQLADVHPSTTTDTALAEGVDA